MSSDIVEVVVEKKKVHRNKEREKAYYEKNKEKWNERVKCQHCDVIISRCSMNRHIKRRHPEQTQ